MLTSHGGRLKGPSSKAVVEFEELLVSRTISVPTYRCPESLSSTPTTLPPAPGISDKRNPVALSLARVDDPKIQKIKDTKPMAEAE
jgi:hypothetical protein